MVVSAWEKIMYARKWFPLAHLCLCAQNLFYSDVCFCFSDYPSSSWYSLFCVHTWVYAEYWRVLKSGWITGIIIAGWNMSVFMWVHYHSAQLGFSEFTLDDLTSHDGTDERSIFSFFTEVMRQKVDMCTTAYSCTFMFTHMVKLHRHMHVMYADSHSMLIVTPAC